MNGGLYLFPRTTPGARVDPPGNRQKTLGVGHFDLEQRGLGG